MESSQKGSVAEGDGLIHNIQQLAKYFGEPGGTLDEVRAQVKRRVYKDTGCGADATVTTTGVEFHTIVEGHDAEFKADVLLFPFPEKQIKEALDYLGNEVDNFLLDFEDEEEEDE